MTEHEKNWLKRKVEVNEKGWLFEKAVKKMNMY